MDSTSDGTSRGLPVEDDRDVADVTAAYLGRAREEFAVETPGRVEAGLPRIRDWGHTMSSLSTNRRDAPLEYESQVEQLTETLERTEPVDGDESPVRKVCAMTGETAIANRSRALIEDATEDEVVVVGTRPSSRATSSPS